MPCICFGAFILYLKTHWGLMGFPRVDFSFFSSIPCLLKQNFSRKYQSFRNLLKIFLDYSLFLVHAYQNNLTANHIKACVT